MNKPTDRESAYLWILKWGILRLRNKSMVLDRRLIALETDHLHNLPGLISRPEDDPGHDWYFTVERKLYLERFEKWRESEDAEDSQDEKDPLYLQFTLTRFQEAWAILEERLEGSSE